jgi:hypothetical protein
VTHTVVINTVASKRPQIRALAGSGIPHKCDGRGRHKVKSAASSSFQIKHVCVADSIHNAVLYLDIRDISHNIPASYAS